MLRRQWLVNATMLPGQWLVNAARLPRQWLVNAMASEIKQMSVTHLRKLCTLGNLPNFYNWLFVLFARERIRKTSFLLDRLQPVCCNFPAGCAWKSTGWPLEINPWSALITHVSPPIASWLPSTDKDHTSKLSLNIIRPNYPVSKLSPSAAKIITHLRLPRQLSHFATLPCSINICTGTKQT